MSPKRYDLKYQVIILVCLSGLLSFPCWSQSIDSYRQQRKALSDNIKLLDASLKGKQARRNSLSRNYELLSQKISMREELQRTITNQLQSIDSMIQTTDGQLSAMHIQQKNLQESSDELLRQEYYRRKTQNVWTSILSKSNMEKMLLQWRRNGQLRDYTDQKINNLEKLTNRIRDTLDYLSDIKQEQQALLNDEEQNLYLLESEKNAGEKALKVIKSEESQIRAELLQQQQKNERLSTLISNMIKREATSTNKSKEAVVFRRGRLLWPVKKGVVTSNFGVRRHPTLKNVKIQNHGIDMLCPAASPVAAVAAGEVLIVTHQPPYDQVVIVSHGDYATAYFYLNTVSVKKGDKVGPGQVLGRLSSRQENQEFHFEIWHNQQQIDPKLWLRPR